MDFILNTSYLEMKKVKNIFEDEDTFLVERNRLGGILLLKGKDNISSSNEIYQQKLKNLFRDFALERNIERGFLQVKS